MKRVGQADEMTPGSISYAGYRFPAGIIGHAVWLCHLFSLSLRDGELILAERASRSFMRASGNGARSSEPTSPASCADAGQSRATPGTSMRCTRASMASCTISGAVDQHGVVLDTWCRSAKRLGGKALLQAPAGARLLGNATPVRYR
jgi:putative transposase